MARKCENSKRILYVIESLIRHYLNIIRYLGVILSYVLGIMCMLLHCFKKLCINILSGQKYLYTAKYQCTDCAIYRLKNQLGTKMGIEICRDQKFIVLALTLLKIVDFGHSMRC